MSNEQSSAYRRYNIRVLASVAVYAVVLVTVIHQFKTNPPIDGWKYALAVAPALPLLAVIAFVGRYLVEETDEFRRFKLMLAMLCGLGVTLALTTVWGFLEAFAGARHIELYLVFVLYCAGMGIAQPIIAWRYR